jgi:hypothetical protein
VGTRTPFLVDGKVNARWSLEFIHDDPWLEIVPAIRKYCVFFSLENIRYVRVDERTSEAMALLIRRILVAWGE